MPMSVKFPKSELTSVVLMQGQENAGGPSHNFVSHGEKESLFIDSKS